MLAKTLVILALAGAAAAGAQKTKHCTGECRTAPVNSMMNKVMPIKVAEYEACRDAGLCPMPLNSTKAATPCVNGMSGEYPCDGVDMLSFLSLADMGTSYDSNDIWGWTDPESKKEYALVGLMDGTAFVDVTDGAAPVFLGKLPTTTDASIWRDVKVFKNYAYIVSEAKDHGMQVFDLTLLRKGPAPSLRYEATFLYTEHGSSHNIVINEDSGFAYSVGTKTCAGGLHMIDLNKDPAKPTFAGCFSADGYTHDAQCVNYDGPDKRFAGQEICFNYNEDTLTIVDVTDKDDVKMLSRVPYDGSQYTHQGWLTRDGGHLVMDDELDEVYGSNPHTRTMVWRVTDLEKPVLTGSFYSHKESIDHNQYVLGDLSFQSNYCAGLRVLNVSGVETAKLEEKSYFDVAPDCDTVAFSGSWSNYPYFASGNIIVTSIERGLFTLKLNK